MTQKVERTVLLDRPPSEVWKYLTEPSLMRNWMGEPEMNIEVITDWIVGNPILVKGFHHINFVNKGAILQFDPERIIQYSYLSSMSRLSDRTENYSIITFIMSPSVKGTLLEIQVENFPTNLIYRHLDFYWQGTATLLKNLIGQ